MWSFIQKGGFYSHCISSWYKGYFSLNLFCAKGCNKVTSLSNKNLWGLPHPVHFFDETMFWNFNGDPKFMRQRNLKWGAAVFPPNMFCSISKLRCCSISTPAIFPLFICPASGRGRGASHLPIKSLWDHINIMQKLCFETQYQADEMVLQECKSLFNIQD